MKGAGIVYAFVPEFDVLGPLRLFFVLHSGAQVEPKVIPFGPGFLINSLKKKEMVVNEWTCDPDLSSRPPESDATEIIEAICGAQNAKVFEGACLRNYCFFLLLLLRFFLPLRTGRRADGRMDGQTGDRRTDRRTDRLVVYGP